MRLRSILVIGALVLASTATATAQSPARAAARSVPAAPNDSLVVSLLTLGPGEALFDRFGHTAIRVRDSRSGLDSAWNWGMYDFNAPNFILRFLTGDTQYWMAGYPTPMFVNHYRQARRAVWEQELALTPAQADSILSFLRWNALPENKFYRYDYYLDNCSTRARDAIDKALNGGLKSSLGALSAPPGVTFRNETLRLSEAFPPIAFGMTFALGPRADAGLTPWDEGFIPMRLRDRLRDVRVADGPLVRREVQLVQAVEYVDAAAAPSYKTPAFIIGLALAALILGLGSLAAKSGAARVLLGAGGSAWHFVIGIAGTLVLFAGLFTKHAFMGSNASVLLGTPVSLALAWFYFRAWSRSATPRTRTTALALTLIAEIAAMVALIATFIPSVGPADIAPALLIAPVHIGLARALRRDLFKPAA